MNRVLPYSLLGLMFLACSGCDVILTLAGTNRTTVRLVNDSDFDVRVVLFLDRDQNTSEDALIDDGENLDFVLAVGEVRTFSRDCNDLQAIIIDDADLLVLGPIGPEDRTDVLRDGDDFGCSDTIEFRFDHSDLLVDFQITVTVDEN